MNDFRTQSSVSFPGALIAFLAQNTVACMTCEDEPSSLARHPASYTQQYFAQEKQSERLGTRLHKVNICPSEVPRAAKKWSKM